MLQVKSYHLSLLPALFFNNTSVVFGSFQLHSNQNPPNTYLPTNLPNTPNLLQPTTNVICITKGPQVPIIIINKNTINNNTFLLVSNTTIINNYIPIPIAVPTNNYTQQGNSFTNQGNHQTVAANINNTQTYKCPHCGHIGYEKNNEEL